MDLRLYYNRKYIQSDTLGSNNRNYHKQIFKISRRIKWYNRKKRWVRINHLIAPLRQHFGVKLGKNYKNFDEIWWDRRERNGDVRNFTQGIHSLITNVWWPDQPLNKICNRMTVDAEMILWSFTLNLQCKDPMKTEDEKESYASHILNLELIMY